MTQFESTHKLDFFSAHWDNPANFHNWQVFKIGTCSGQWNCIGDSYILLSIVNSQPGNGHFDDVFDWFEHSCKRDGKSLKIIAVINNRLAKHLITKRGFRYYTDENLVKEFPTALKV